MLRHHNRLLLLVLVATLALGFGTGTSAHPHEAENAKHGEGQVVANGQNHPGFVENTETGMYESCEGIAPLPNMGPAGYGLETAHHGPDQGTSGKADGCFATEGAPQDDNPGLR